MLGTVQNALTGCREGKKTTEWRNSLDSSVGPLSLVRPLAVVVVVGGGLGAPGRSAGQAGEGATGLATSLAARL